MNLVVHVEGQTEERFVDTLLAPHLDTCGYSAVRAGFIGGMQGGITSWTVAQRDIVNHLEEDPECIATTMVDYYGLPATGARSWPEIDDSRTTAPSKRIEALVPGYQKPVMGTLAAQEIGLQTMREACPHFGQWIARLERLPVEAQT